MSVIICRLCFMFSVPYKSYLHYCSNKNVLVIFAFAAILQLIAGNSNDNRRMLGPTLNKLPMQRDCQNLLLASGHNDDPSAFNDRLWIIAPYTLDEETIYAVVHDEFHGEERPNICPSRQMNDCWYCTLLGAISQDGGKTYNLYPLEERIVASVPQTYQQASFPTGSQELLTMKTFEILSSNQ